MYSIPKDFKQFISSDCRRGDFIQDFLKNNGIDAPAINLNGKFHLYVKFQKYHYDKKYPVKTVLAHYDRVSGSPGANDNSSSAFLLMKWAVKLNKMKTPHNIRLIFTDGEECGEEGIKSQGAFDLGVLFKRLNILEDDIFVFDCMGRGTVPVICKNEFSEKISQDFKSHYSELELKTEKLLTLSAGQFVKLSCNYSDNAGFIANGIPAVAITMLPYEEINLYKKGLQLSKNDKNFTKDDMQRFLPETWKLFHTRNDNFESLQPEAFELTEKILENLAAIR